MPTPRRDGAARTMSPAAKNRRSSNMPYVGRWILRWTCRSSPSSRSAAAMNSRWSADSSTNDTTADSPRVASVSRARRGSSSRIATSAARSWSRYPVRPSSGNTTRPARPSRASATSSRWRARLAGLVVFPELGLTGYLLQDLAAEVAMRLDDPRLASSRPRPRRALRRGLVRGGVRGPPAVHRRRAARGRRDPPRPPQDPPAHVRHVRRAALLRPRRRDPRRAVPPGRGHGPGRVRGLLAPLDAAAPRARRRADPGQRLVVARAGPGDDATRWASGRRPPGGR